MRYTDYSIEFAHIYLDQKFNTEHKKSILLLKKIKRKLKKRGKNFITLVMIDDYNAKRHVLNVEKFIENLIKLKAKPDFIIFESKLAKNINKILELMSNKIKRDYLKYIKTHNKIPCSLFLAVWYLTRFGKFDYKYLIKNNLIDNIIKKKNGEVKKNNVFFAKKLINILPRKYEKVEEKAKKIILSTKYANLIDDIENIFY